MISRLSFLDGLIHPVHEVLAVALVLAILYIAAPKASDVSVLLVFAFVLYRVQPRIKELDAAHVRLAALSSSVEEVVSLIDNRHRR